MHINLAGYDWSRVKGYEELSENGKEELAELGWLAVCDQCGRPTVYEQYRFGEDIHWCGEECVEAAIGMRKWYLEYHDAGNGRPDRSLEPASDLPDNVKDLLRWVETLCWDPKEYAERLAQLAWFGFIVSEGDTTYWTEFEEDMGGEVMAFLDQLHWDKNAERFREETR